MRVSACIEAPAEAVWAHLAQLDRIDLWSDAVHRAHISSPCTSGVGTERTCALGGDRTLRERVTRWEAGRSFTYESTDAPFLAFARNRWSIEPAGERSVVVSEAEIVPRGGWLAYALGWLMLPLVLRLMPHPLAKFKYWVENGHPHPGTARSLPVPAPTC